MPSIMRLVQNRTICVRHPCGSWQSASIQIRQDLISYQNGGKDGW